nr:MAG TPA: hypothetical protein [Caudoviricetes sp.]
MAIFNETTLPFTITVKLTKRSKVRLLLLFSIVALGVSDFWSKELNDFLNSKFKSVNFRERFSCIDTIDMSNNGVALCYYQNPHN